MEARRPPHPPADPGPRLLAAQRRWGLTRRETEVLALLCRGETNRVIARRLGCAGRTLEAHVTRLLEKTDSETRSALVARFWTELDDGA